MTTILTKDVLVYQPKLLEEFDTQKVSWNPHKHCLAFVSGKDQVTVHEFEDSGEIYLLSYINRWIPFLVFELFCLSTLLKPMTADFSKQIVKNLAF
jgi:hypothetical protein